MCKETNKEKKTNLISGIYEWIEELVISIVLVVILFSFIFRVVTVNGNSMLPNYQQGDRLIVSAINAEVKQGDVVVIVDTLDNPIIKRVIATEGQEINIDNETGAVFVDGKELDNSVYGVSNGITFTDDTMLESMEFPQVVPDNCVFVLGDNRVISEDSRYVDVGMVDTKKIIGTSIFRIFPFNKIGSVV